MTLSDRAHDRIEREATAFFERVREGYLHIAATEPRVNVIDATQPLAAVQRDIGLVLEKLRSAAQ